MKLSDIKIGKYYQIGFLDKWTSFNGAYKITGYASPDVVTTINDGKSIYSVFFAELGLDIDLYNSYIDDSTLVYVATKLVTTDPIEESIDSAESTVYIPSTLIVPSESYEYTRATKLTYRFITNPRVFKSELDLNDYETEAKNIIKEAIVATKEFLADKISVDVFETETLVTNLEMKEFEDTREQKRLAIQTAENQWRTNQESAERQMYLATLDMESSKKNYDSRYTELTSKINDANKIVQNNIDQRNYLNRIKERVIEVIGDIMVRQPTAFDGIQGLPVGYTATQVYDRIYQIVSEN